MADQDIPEHIMPKNVLALTDEQLEAEIAARQKRRLAAFRIYSELQAVKQATRDDKLKARLTKELAAFEKELAQVDKKLNSINDRVNKIKGIRLELGDETFDITKRDEV